MVASSYSCPKILENPTFKVFLAFQGSKLVDLINPVAVANGSEAARVKYGVVLGVEHGKDLQTAGRKW